jgi:glycosyltransferase involved in cell wall biosynthesis
MTRIALVIGQLGLGGAEKQLCLLASELPKWDYQPLVIALSQGGEREEELRGMGIKTIALPRNGATDLRRLRQLVNILRGFRPEIIHGYDCGGALYGKLAGIIAGSPVLIGGVRCEWTLPKKIVYAERLLRRKTDAVISNSFAGKRCWAAYTGYPEARIAVVPNGFNLEGGGQPPNGFRPLRGLLNLPADEPIIGCIGSLFERKKPMMFVDLAASVTARGAKAHFVWIGDGVMRPELERAIDSRGLRGVVHLLGKRTDALWLARDFNVGVLTSMWEGLPNVLMEYMFWGLPVITTNAGDCTELVEHQRTGYVVEKNDLAAMSAYVLRLIEDRTAASEIGRRGRERLENDFSVKSMVEKTVAVYQEARARKQVGGSNLQR